MANEYRDAVLLSDEYSRYPIYDRMGKTSWGSDLDVALMAYIAPSGGYLEIGDSKPLVFMYGPDLRIILKKANGEYWVLHLIMEHKEDELILAKTAMEVR